MEYHKFGFVNIAMEFVDSEPHIYCIYVIVLDLVGHSRLDFAMEWSNKVY